MALTKVSSLMTEINTKIIDIGDWDMSSATGVDSVDVNHGLTLSKIRNVMVLIRKDDDTQFLDINVQADPSASTFNNGILIASTYVRIYRFNGGVFDSTLYDTMGDDGNRGWITIQYVD